MKLYSPVISGSLTVTGSTTFIGNITMSGSLSATASNASLLDGTGSVGFTTTGSFTTMSGSVSTRVSQIENVYATTGSNSFRATQSITGSLTVTGQIIAQTLNVQQVTSSIVFSSGSNTFGCDINSRQVFTGSFYQTGSVAIFSNTVCVPVSHVSNNIQIGYGGAPAGTGKLFISRGDQYGLNINAQSGYVRIQGDDDLLAINRGGVDILSMSACNHLGIRTTASPFAALRVCQCANNNDYAVRIQAVFGINDYLDSDANRIFGGGLSETQFLNGSSSRPAMISLGGNLATSETLGVINFFRSDNASTYRSRSQIWAATNGSGCSTTLGGYLTFTTADTGQTNPTQKLTIASNGVSTFACTVCAPTVVRCASKWVLNGAIEGGNNACALTINTDNARAIHVRGIVGGISGQTMTSLGMYEAILYRIGSSGGNESKRLAVLVDCNASPGNSQGIQMNVINDTLYIQNKTGMSYAQTINVWAEIFYA